MSCTNWRMRGARTSCDAEEENSLGLWPASWPSHHGHGGDAGPNFPNNLHYIPISPPLDSLTAFLYDEVPLRI